MERDDVCQQNNGRVLSNTVKIDSSEKKSPEN